MINEFVNLTGYEMELIPVCKSQEYISERYLELLEEYKKGGKYPVVCSADEILMEKFELDLADNGLPFNNEGFSKLVKKYLKDSEKVDVGEFFNEEKKKAIVSSIQFEMGKYFQGEPVLELLSIFDSNENTKNELVIVKLDIKNPYEVFAYLPMGGFNDCPLPDVMVAVSKYWYEKYKAYPCAVSYDECEYYLEEVIKDSDTIKDLAAEHFIYDVDIVDQCVGDFQILCEYFYNNNQWYFWWD